ncbi:shikimate kinase AroL [Pseudodesulfovibrio sp. JC047]|uniref:shikimate kinase AroL n=1 Tax=Pseudodesulfovibrio sp. JC047 TaxID=2683199 RepID=UPI0013D56746|nr:shikimate kinase AroL [Pseudodesulfovibrio sp. JC047]NDV18988.1 shikimate kinase AroL [Pseudodesulfovibrio sp. JC047]
MDRRKNIFLIGPRACGKTSVGRRLAARLNSEFVDTDHALVQSVGCEIEQYVALNGWEAFREREAAILARESEPGGRVIGCGGGIVLKPENRTILRTGIVIYLKVDPVELVRRLRRDPNTGQRPSLTGQGLTAEVETVLAQRAPLYESCADYVVSAASVASVVENILARLERSPGLFDRIC